MSGFAVNVPLLPTKKKKQKMMLARAGVKNSEKNMMTALIFATTGEINYRFNLVARSFRLSDKTQLCID